MSRDGSQTKALIDDIALRLFVEKGVTATTIKDIATTAGIAEGTIYCHYDSKQELAWELFAKNIMELAVNLDRCQQEHQALKDKMAAFINLCYSFFDAKPGAVQLPAPRPSRPYPQNDPGYAQPREGAEERHRPGDGGGGDPPGGRRCQNRHGAGIAYPGGGFQDLWPYYPDPLQSGPDLGG